MRWSEVPSGARRYIIYHVLVSPVLITWHMLPLYMLMTGYSILEVGLVFSAVRLVSIPATYLVGRAFDRMPVRHGLVVIEVLEALARILYGLAKGSIAPVMLFLGLLVERVTRIFYPLYQVAERLLYPRERMEEVLAWHMRLPEAAQLVGFLALGYLFGHVYSEPGHYRMGFLAMGVYSLALVAYLLYSLPPLDASERLGGGERMVFRVDREFRLILAIETFMVLAWSLAPGIVMLYYVVEVLGLTLFEAMVVEASVSIGAILATYVSEKISRQHRFQAMALGYSLVALWALIMTLGPSFAIVVLAYFIARFGEVLAFPFYRAWLFSKIPEDKAGSLLAALSSYRQVIGLASPALAGLLASLAPTLPYLASLVFFIFVSFLMLYGHRFAQLERSPV